VRAGRGSIGLLDREGGEVKRKDSQSFDLANIKDRIVELRRMYPSELKEHPGQWREHTEAQAGALAGVLKQIGITDTLLAWPSEREGGALTVFDGHLRRSLDSRVKWPVLITDLTDEEADFALATHDPLTAMAQADRAALDAILSSVHSDDESVQAMLAELAEKEGIIPPDFQPVGEDEQGRLDEKKKVVCPECGHEFTP